MLRVKYFDLGQSHSDKVAKVREELQKKNAKAIVVTMLDEIAWLFNLRGSDIDFNPGMSNPYANILNRHLTNHVVQYFSLMP